MTVKVRISVPEGEPRGVSIAGYMHVPGEPGERIRDKSVQVNVMPGQSEELYIHSQLSVVVSEIVPPTVEEPVDEQ